MKILNIHKEWNKAIERPDREIKARDYLYASEIGGSLVDTYFKLQGEPYTNPADNRAKRKMWAGDRWEDIIKDVLVKAGINFTQQDRVELKLADEFLSIHGKIDFVIEGRVKDIKLDGSESEEIKSLVEEVHETLKEQVFEKQILEVKSVGSFVMDYLEESDKPKTNHMYQAWVYAKATNLPTSIIYICRDDCRMLQYEISNIADQIEPLVLDWVRNVSYYYKNQEIPPLEKFIVIGDNAKLNKNWKVEYSSYLTKLYGIGTPAEFFDEITKEVSGANRVLKRIREGEKMTDSNLSYIELMLTKYSINLNEVAKIPIKTG